MGRRAKKREQEAIGLGCEPDKPKLLQGDKMSKANSTAKMRRYLESLTKDELINLILKLAPQSFIDNIHSQFANKKEALTIFNKASRAAL